MPVLPDNSYQRPWAFVDRFAEGDEAPRQDFDAVLGDMSAGITAALQNVNSLAATIRVIGSSDTEAGLPSTASDADAWVVGPEASEYRVVFLWINSQWRRAFGFTAPQGPAGASGDGSGDLVSTQNLSDLANIATALTNLRLMYLTRAAFVSANSVLSGLGRADGHVVTAGGFAYKRATGSTAISDLPGWVSAGTAYLEHWGVVTTTTPQAATTDYTTQVNAAMTATRGQLIFTGWAKVSNLITAPNYCSPVVPNGAFNGGLVVRSDFNMAAAAILRLGSAGLSCRGVRIGIWCEQPTSPASRADLTQYPWAVDLAGLTRGEIEELRIMQAWNGINGQGNCGGLRLGLVEIGAFNVDAEFDGPLDFIHVDSWQSWPFDFAGNSALTAIFYDGTGEALRLGKVDGWTCDKFSTFRKKVVIEDTSATAQIIPRVFGSMSLDGDGARLLGVKGRLLIGNLYSTKSTTPTDPSILISGADVSVANGSLAGGEAVQVRVTSGSYSQRGGEMFSNALDKISMDGTGGAFDLSGVLLRWGSGARTAPQITQSGTCVARIAGLRPAVFTGASPLVSITTDVAGTFIETNSLTPHTTDLPATIINGLYDGPRIAATATCSFATPGTSSFTYGVRTIYLDPDGYFISTQFRLVFTPTIGTASGNLVIDVPGAPLSAQAAEIPVAVFAGVTLTGGRTELALRRQPDGTFQLIQCGSGVSSAICTTANFTSGTEVTILATGVMAMRL